MNGLFLAIVEVFFLLLSSSIFALLRTFRNSVVLALILKHHSLLRLCWERQCYEPWPKYCITSMQQSAVLQGVHTESYNVDDGSIDSIIKQQMLSRCDHVGACSGCSLRWRLNYCDNALHSSSPTSHWSVTLSTLYSTHHSKAQVDIIISLTLALCMFVCCRKYSNIPHK